MSVLFMKKKCLNKIIINLKMKICKTINSRENIKYALLFVLYVQYLAVTEIKISLNRKNNPNLFTLTHMNAKISDSSAC